MTDDTSHLDNDREIIRNGAKKIQGVFSRQSVGRGSDTSQRKTIEKVYWSVMERDDGNFVIKPLNSEFVPIGVRQIVSRNEFLAEFSPEPEFYVNKVYPAMEAMARSEDSRSSGSDSDVEQKRTAAVDEDNVRASFGLGLTYLDEGEQQKAQDLFDRLAQLKAPFQKEHKHLFNDFGINMRKNQMFDQALQYYKRAEMLVQDDEHLFHNIARCYYEKGDVEECKRYLKKSLRVNPLLEESQLFWEYLKEQGIVGRNEIPG